MGWEQLFAHAQGHDGVVTNAAALAVGIGRDRLAWRARAEGWTRLHPGLYVVGGVAITDRTILRAAVDLTGGAAARGSALWLHDMVEKAPAKPQVIVPFERRGTRWSAIEATRSRTLRGSHLTSVGDLSATTVARSLFDVAPRSGPRRIRNLLLEGRQAGKVSVTELRELRDEFGRGVPGLAVMDKVLADLGDLRSDSGFEHEVRAGLLDHGFDVHHEPYEYTCEDGVTVSLDVAIPARAVVIESDGFGPHTQRRVFETDRVRWTQITRHWRTVWVTVDRWRNARGAFFRDVARAVELGPPTSLKLR